MDQVRKHNSIGASEIYHSLDKIDSTHLITCFQTIPCLVGHIRIYRITINIYFRKKNIIKSVSETWTYNLALNANNNICGQESINHRWN